MPTKTFFNLSQAKQQRLLKAARQEFSRVPLYDASINKIIATAGIPRGSFYQYFKDKTDLYYYYFEKLNQEHKNLWLKTLRDNHGDLFISFRQYFSRLIGEITAGQDAPFYRNLFLNMSYKNGHKMSFASHQAHHDREFYSLVDTSCLRITSEYELKMLMRILMATVFQTLGSYYFRQQQGQKVSVTQLKHEFTRTLDWLEHGIAVRPANQH